MIDRIRETMRELYFGTAGDHSFLRRLFIPAVPLYKGVRFLDQAVRTIRRKQLDTPVVSVGNISIGGTGKTTFVQWLVSALIDRGFEPAILKRGEGDSDGILMGAETDSDLRSYGDEVALLQEALPDVPIGVGPSRYDSGATIKKNRDVDLFIMDDGFQHRQLVRNLDIVLLGSLAELSQWELPAGPLREPITGLERADVVSMNQSGLDPDESWKTKLEQTVSIREDQVITGHRYRFEGIFRDGDDVTAEFKKGSEPIHLLTTLARPHRLETFLEKEGIKVDKHVKLPDHGHIDSAVFEGELTAEQTLVTDKEWVKLPADRRRAVGRLRSSLVVEDADRVLREVLVLLEGDRS